MANKATKKPRNRVQINLEPDSDIPEIIDLDAHEEAYLQLRGELAQDEGAQVEINRQVGRTTRDVEFMDTVPLADYPDLLKLKVMVANTFGAGLYVMKLRYNGRFKKHFQLKVGARALAPAAQGETQGLQALFESFSNKLYDALTRGQAPQRDRLEDFIMYSKLAKELNGGGGGNMDPWELMDRVEKMADKRARALIGQEPAAAEGKHWAIEALDRIAPVMMDGIAALRESRVVSVQHPRAVQEAAAAQPAAAGDEPGQQHTTTGGNPMFDAVIANVLKPYLPFLGYINLIASQEGDVEVYATVVLDQVPERIAIPGMGEIELTDELLAKGLSRPDALDLFLRAYPPAGQFRGWYARLLPVVLSLLVPEKPGDVGDPS